MKTLTACACAAGLLLCSVAPCFAAGSPWDGTWKLNEAKSKMTGDTFSLTALPNGGFHYANSNKSLEYDYTCDGKEYTEVEHWTGTCKKVDATHYEMAGKMDGKPEWAGTSVISDGGKFMNNTATEHRPDGTSSTSSNRYERVGAGNGRAGTWKNVKSSDSAPDTMKVKLDGDVLRSESPAFKSVTTAKLDGSVAHIDGPGVPDGFELKMKAEGPATIRFVTAYKGKAMSEGIEKLSADGKTMIQESWDPGNENDKQTFVYEKQ